MLKSHTSHLTRHLPQQKKKNPVLQPAWCPPRSGRAGAALRNPRPQRRGRRGGEEAMGRALRRPLTSIYILTASKLP